MSKAKTIKDATNEAELRAAAEAAAGELPPAGDERREVLKKREETLEEKAEKMAAQMMMGTIDPKHLEIAREIAAKTQYLDVSNKVPGRVYRWISTNRSGQHVQIAKNLGWVVVQGDDQEAIELIDQTPGTTRELGDVILMWMPAPIPTSPQA